MITIVMHSISYTVVDCILCNCRNQIFDNMNIKARLGNFATIFIENIPARILAMSEVIYPPLPYIPDINP